MRLVRQREEARILDPRAGFSEAVSVVEVRVDPLTGARSRINISRTARPKQGLAKVEAASAAKCLFCPESLETAVPKFPPSFFPGGRYRSGGAVLFPNLFPLAGSHGVCVFTPEHKIELDRFRAEELLDGLVCSRMFMGRAAELGQPEHFLGWNHLPAAGASILHPHFQMICSEKPLLGQGGILKASEGYFCREGKDFWSELVECERPTARFIGETEGFVWLAPWAPFGAFEVMGISEKPSVMQLEQRELEGLADGIVRVLKGYSGIGVASINMGTFSTAGIRADGHFRASVRVMARPGTGMSDRALLELYGSEIGLSTLPEDYAGAIKTQFR